MERNFYIKQYRVFLNLLNGEQCGASEAKKNLYGHHSG